MLQQECDDGNVIDGDGCTRRGLTIVKSLWLETIVKGLSNRTWLRLPHDWVARSQGLSEDSQISLSRSVLAQVLLTPCTPICGDGLRVGEEDRSA